MGEAGGLLTEVIHTKSQTGGHFTIVDAAMNDLIRPCLYEAYHEICPVKLTDRPLVITDVVGPICETGDFLGLSRKLNEPLPGELLLIKNVGAYGFSMASNYNSRPRAAEVLVSDREVKVIRKRETLESLWQFEV
jgi:diaminopimelate decarboxylase